MRKNFIKDIRSMVVKVGTSILTREGRFDKNRLDSLAGQISVFLKKGIHVSVVSSGAIGAGMVILKETRRPETMQGLQAAAAVGQRYLMQCWEEAFSKRGFSTAQVLLTWEDLAHKNRFINAKGTLKEIQRRGLVPIINENDTVATDEIRFGDNDKLSALIAILLEADVLTILSDTDGLCARSAGGNGQRIQIVEKVSDNIFAHAQDQKKDFTVGGMRSKLSAVRMSVNSGVPVFLASGRDRDVLSRLFAGEDIGTFFLPQAKKGKIRKDWVLNFSKQIKNGKKV